MNSDISAILAEAEQTRMSAEEAKKKEEEAAAAAQRAIQQSSSSSSSSNGSSASYSGSVSGWVNPAPGKYVTSGFGSATLHSGDFHQGVDLSNSYEPVYCMADGTVTTAGWFGTGGGTAATWSTMAAEAW